MLDSAKANLLAKKAFKENNGLTRNGVQDFLQLGEASK